MNGQVKVTTKGRGVLKRFRALYSQVRDEWAYASLGTVMRERLRLPREFCGESFMIKERYMHKRSPSRELMSECDR